MRFDFVRRMIFFVCSIKNGIEKKMFLCDKKCERLFIIFFYIFWFDDILYVRWLIVDYWLWMICECGCKYIINFSCLVFLFCFWVMVLLLLLLLLFFVWWIMLSFDCWLVKFYLFCYVLGGVCVEGCFGNFWFLYWFDVDFCFGFVWYFFYVYEFIDLLFL